MLGPEGAPGPVALCAERDTGLVTRGDSGPGRPPRAPHSSMPLSPGPLSSRQTGPCTREARPATTASPGALEAQGRGVGILPSRPPRGRRPGGSRGGGAALPLSSHLFLLSSCGRPSGLVRSHTPLGKRVRVAGPQRARPGPGHLPACRRPRWMEVDGGGRRGWGTTHGPPPESGALPRLQSGGPLGQCQRHDAAAPPRPPPVACAISAPRGLSQREMCSGGGGAVVLAAASSGTAAPASTSRVPSCPVKRQLSLRRESASCTRQLRRGPGRRPPRGPGSLRAAWPSSATRSGPEVWNQIQSKLGL